MVSPRPISLAPRRPNSCTDLNRSLDEFYDQHAVKETAGEWFAQHTYQEVYAREARLFMAECRSSMGK